MRGRRITSWPSVRTDLVNAGATWVDEEAVVDTAGPNTLISSRRPDDLKAFCAAIVDHFRPAGDRSRPAGAGLNDAEAARLDADKLR